MKPSHTNEALGPSHFSQQRFALLESQLEKQKLLVLELEQENKAIKHLFTDSQKSFEEILEKNIEQRALISSYHQELTNLKQELTSREQIIEFHEKNNKMNKNDMQFLEYIQTNLLENK